MSTLYALLIQPFTDYPFMLHALMAAVALSLSAAPLGVFLVLRRMTLMADSMSHAILPGVAAGFILSTVSTLAMVIGGLVAGLAVALLSGWVSRKTRLKEDASFGAFYLMALGLGVAMISVRGSNADLIHVLFGTILGVDQFALIFILVVAFATMALLMLFYRPLVMECFDAVFLSAEGGKGARFHFLFLVLLVLNLVAGFKVFGTLMVVGIMLLPAITASFWGRTIGTRILISILIGVLSSYIGLVVSFYIAVPTSSAIILMAGTFYVITLLVRRGGLIR